MQICFYCRPKDLREIFMEAEHAYPLVYEPRFGCPPRIREMEKVLRKPFHSCCEFREFGRAYHKTPPFEVYTQEDRTRDRYSPNLLYFSGPPAALEDPYVLCEGSLFLDPENKEDEPRALYKNIRKMIAGRFVKSGYCFISPAVYGSRKEYLFIQRDHNFLAPAWYFDNEDRHVPIDIDAWYGRKGKQRGEYTKPDGKFQFFSASEDLEMVFSKLEERHNLKYIRAVRQRSGSYEETVWDSFAAFMDHGSRDKVQEAYVCDRNSRMLFYLRADFQWEQCRKAAGVSEAMGIENAFGDSLYRDFMEIIKGQFPVVGGNMQKTFFISPLLYGQRDNIILNLHDPYFRIDGNGECVHVWRREWEELLASWGITGD